MLSCIVLFDPTWFTIALLQEMGCVCVPAMNVLLDSCIGSGLSVS